ncbi:MAG: hypothetical protein K9G36_03170 [Crocinitomicaceae bacterium]|nr:hypothetical protein [Crocinitomicaceae bacterium]MCF8411471.1 hypothetical protein [Crocinitomicaceae bacterium]MCF8443718.1 hypothetical protein [Crocinitomicaceae bacterium]
MFTESFKFRIERITLQFGITAFLIHASLIFAIKFGFLNAQYFPQNLFGNPFEALFSPFSSLLVYEVYLLIYYLRKSYTKSVAKQLEIMALILLRNCFKDVGYLTDGHTTLLNSELVKDLSGFILLLILVWFFYHLDSKRETLKTEMTNQFIKLKERLSVLLMIIFFTLSIYSFSNWIIDLLNYSTIKGELGDPSKVFYTEFFTLLTFVDVILLLSSARNLKNTILVIRNSGYVLATFLTRVSFSLEGWERIIMLVLGALIAVFMLWISQRQVFTNLNEDSTDQ